MICRKSAGAVECARNDCVLLLRPCRDNLVASTGLASSGEPLLQVKQVRQDL